MRRRTVADESLVQRWAARGALFLGALGAIVGLIVGLIHHAATAWAAMFEIGVPSFVLGAAVGALVGWIASARRRVL